MIQKNNIALVIDTNILGDIVKEITVDTSTIEQSHDVKTVLVKWILKIIENMEKQPKGKKITIFASTNTIHDYETGLSRAGHKNISNNISDIFKRHTSRSTTIPKSQNITLSLRKFHVKPTTSKKRLNDKNDENFLVLSESIAKQENWKDYQIIFASRDKQTAYMMTDIFSINIHTSRLHVASNLECFEKLIEC